MAINKDSRIVEVFSANMLNKEVANKADFKNELKDANEYIKELASAPNPMNMYEIGQIMQFVVDEGFQRRVAYMDQIADVKRTGLGEKAQFKLGIDGIKAMFQAKSATTERSKVANKFFTMDTDEVSVRPVVNFLELQLGKTDMTKLAASAALKLEMAIVKRIQDATYAAFASLGSPNYASGAGITKSGFDPILNAMKRVGGSASVMGDVEALAKFTSLAGFNNTVADQLALEHNQNGMIGKYLGANLMQLDNPLQVGSLTKTELRKDLIYVLPTGDVDLRPIKVQFEGGVQSITSATPNMDSKEVEFRFDQYVGVSTIGTRKLMGIYEDTTLA
ncbi:hypothetical protein AAXE64_08560 [Priestia megaterium]